MLGRSHVIMGVAAWTHVVPTLFSSNQTVLAAIFLGPLSAAGALAPDLDHPHSQLGRKFPKLSKIIGGMFGHRGFTHSLFLVVILLLLSFLATSQVSGALLFGPLAAFIVGFLSHIFADWHTVRGVPLLWPLKKNFRLPLLNCKTGSRREDFYCFLWLMAGLQCLSASVTGGDPYYFSLFESLGDAFGATPVSSLLHDAIEQVEDAADILFDFLQPLFK